MYQMNKFIHAVTKAQCTGIACTPKLNLLFYTKLKQIKSIFLHQI